MFSHSLFIRVLSDNNAEELESMIVEWNLKKGICQEKNREELVIEGGRAWAAPLCGSFYCPFLCLIKASQHKLKVT